MKTLYCTRCDNRAFYSHGCEEMVSFPVFGCVTELLWCFRTLPWHALTAVLQERGEQKPLLSF